MSDVVKNTDATLFLKPAQIEAMRDAAYEGRHGPRNDAIITLVYDTGLRRTELTKVDRNMIDLDDETVRIPAGIQNDYSKISPKTMTLELDRSGNLCTVQTLREWLSSRGDSSSALFPSQRTSRMSPKAINDVINRCAERAEVRPFSVEGRGIPSDVSPQTLRHSTAWRMLREEEGYTLDDVRNRLRYTTLLATKKEYRHFQTLECNPS
ncbi:tyrosine-type recombinase/integrase [Haloplanus halophilus]|uniref:tyrosine-type recombinase/integrase n=1 Tax=Haloplanus halophilus TaxID=2949993 RepID=UPI0021122EDB|nr:tyrosine-type recombinase/integrase [Haloplanus sp. GDY1]